MENPTSSSESAMPSASATSDVFQPRKNTPPKRAKPPVCITIDPFGAATRRASQRRPLAAKARNRHYRTLSTSSRKNCVPMLSPLASAQTRSVADAMAAGHFGPSALKRRADEVRQHYDR